MKTLIASALVLLAVNLARAEMQTPIPLWPGGAPGALGTNDTDIPTITPYPADATNATGRARARRPTSRSAAPGTTARE